jgi:hypothetical protein
MTEEDIKKRFVNEIKLRAYDDKYIDKNEEREILEIAIQHGISIETARATLIQVCEENSYIIESVILKQIKDQIETASRKNGMVERGEFESVCANIKQSVQGKKNDREIRKLIVLVMENTLNNRTKRGWFTDWYGSLKKDLGIT